MSKDQMAQEIKDILKELDININQAGAIIGYAPDSVRKLLISKGERGLKKVHLAFKHYQEIERCKEKLIDMAKRIDEIFDRFGQKKNIAEELLQLLDRKWNEWDNLSVGEMIEKIMKEFSLKKSKIAEMIGYTPVYIYQKSDQDGKLVKALKLLYFALLFTRVCKKEEIWIIDKGNQPKVNLDDLKATLM